MSTVKGLRAGVAAAILAGMALLAGPVSAQNGAQDEFSTERPGSVLIFPKVVNTSDTVIQIANTTNIAVDVHCFYVDGRQVNGQPNWQVTDFDLALTRQQPTHWGVGEGRAVNPLDNTAGLDPGLIPPVSPGFSGFLVCVQVGPSGEPFSGNALKGEATIGTRVPASSPPNGVRNVSKYNAIAIPGIGQNDGDNVLSLDGIEYAACPRDLLLNFPADGGPDPALAGAGNTASIVSSNLTLVPCGMDFENLIPDSTTLDVNLRNEFEEASSVSSGVPVDCWFSDDLGAPLFGNKLTIGGLGSEFGTAILNPLAPGELPGLGVVNVLRTADNGTSDTAASNLFWPAGGQHVNSEIRLPTQP